MVHMLPSLHSAVPQTLRPRPAIPVSASATPHQIDKLVPFQKFLHTIDFKKIGESPVRQLQIIYGACIVSRLIAANERRRQSQTKSWNEIKEFLRRDPTGAFFWFFGTPLVRMLYLKMIPKDIRDHLILENKPKNAPQGNILQRFIHKASNMNPLICYQVPTSEQVKDQWKQALHDLKPGSKAHQETNAFFSRLMMHRNIATGLGLLCTIAILGIGINLLNIYLTQRNNEKRKAAMLGNMPHTPINSSPFGASMPMSNTPPTTTAPAFSGTAFRL